jgi:Ca-activated chloride channel homolog
MKKISRFTLIIMAMLIISSFARAQESKKTRILFVMDASNSMWAKWGNTTRIAAAKKILINLFDSLQNIPNVEFALRCYGFQSPVSVHDCKDTKLVVSFHDNNAKEIIDFIRNVKPNGYTPIAYSLTQTAQDFPNDKAKNVVILITDGIEECDGDPCTVSKQLQKRNIILRPYIVGIGLDEEKMKFFDCVGRYYQPHSEKDLGKILNSVVNDAINNTTVVVQLLDKDGNPTQTNAEMCFTNAKNGKVEYNFYHTMNSENKPDTFTLDPSMKYNLQVNTVPPVTRQNITLQMAKNNVIKLTAPMGYMEIKSASSEEYGIPCLVKKAGEHKIVNVQNINTIDRYITGSYDLEILTLPRISIPAAMIRQDETNSIVIPQSGKVDFVYGADVIGQLFILRNNTMENVIDIYGAGTSRKESFRLQPGNYIVIYRRKESHNAIETKQAEFRIISGGSETVTLN